jgi:hypothetical protein
MYSEFHDWFQFHCHYVTILTRKYEHHCYVNLHYIPTSSVLRVAKLNLKLNSLPHWFSCCQHIAMYRKFCVNVHSGPSCKFSCSTEHLPCLENLAFPTDISACQWHVSSMYCSEHKHALIYMVARKSIDLAFMLQNMECQV